jgi:hypothetical protein
MYTTQPPGRQPYTIHHTSYTRKEPYSNPDFLYSTGKRIMAASCRAELSGVAREG